MKSARPQTPLSLQTAALLGKPAAFFGRSDGDLLAARLAPVEIADALAERPAGETHVLGDGHVPAAALAPFDLTRQLSSNRTQGVPNMVALVQDTARRIAGA